MSTGVPAAYLAAEDLERVLGDPRDGAATMSFRRQVEHDDREEYPHEALEALRKHGFPAYLVPSAFGGRLCSFEELLALCRCVARRDLTCAVAFGTLLLGANPVWLWGDARQRARVAELIDAGEAGSFAMSEADHGSDLLACEVRARPVPGGFRLGGTKWPVGNATRGGFATVFARTSDRPGLRGFSLLLVDKAELDEREWINEPRVPTVGLRGHDLSGITFLDCLVPGHALVGRAGHGADQTLKALQLTRTLIASLSLGAADTALRVALAHARGRRMYGRTVDTLPVVREHLVGAYADLLIGECVTVPVCRAITVAPGRLSLWSSVVKYLVPVLGEEIMTGLGRVLSARGYLRAGVGDGIFQKMWRDAAIASVFEGTTHVNLQVVEGQLPAVLPPREVSGETLHALFSRTAGTPAWQPGENGLLLSNGGRDEVSQGWPAALDRLRESAPGPLTDAALALDAEWHALRADVAASRDAGTSWLASADGAEAARRFCLLFAAAACLHTWLANRDDGPAYLAEGEWLLLCFRRLLARLRGGAQPPLPYSPLTDRQLADGLAENRLFSLTPIRLG